MRGSARLQRLSAGDGVVERRQTIERRLEIGEADIIGDEEIHRFVDAVEGRADLVERAEAESCRAK